jgi:hypothetical protein
MAQVHSGEEWSHLRSNPLELSSSLRSKRLTEDYYASLALVFKSVKLPQDSQYGNKHLSHSVYAMLQGMSNSKPNLARPNSAIQCRVATVSELQHRTLDVQCPHLQPPVHCPKLQYHRAIPRIEPTWPILGLLHRPCC